MYRIRWPSPIWRKSWRCICQRQCTTKLSAPDKGQLLQKLFSTRCKVKETHTHCIGAVMHDGRPHCINEGWCIGKQGSLQCSKDSKDAFYWHYHICIVVKCVHCYDIKLTAYKMAALCSTQCFSVQLPGFCLELPFHSMSGSEHSSIQKLICVQCWGGLCPPKWMNFRSSVQFWLMPSKVKVESEDISGRQEKCSELHVWKLFGRI